jgi:hypothetical protein
MASVRKIAEELEPRPVVTLKSSVAICILAIIVGGIIAPIIVSRVIHPLGVLHVSMMSNVNEVPHFDINEEMHYHIMSEDILPLDEGI